MLVVVVSFRRSSRLDMLSTKCLESGDVCSPKILQGLLPKSMSPGWLGYIGDEILPSYIGLISRAFFFPDPY